jgi:hypothetical protein
MPLAPPPIGAAMPHDRRTVHILAGQRRQLQERTAWVDDTSDTVTRKQLATVTVALGSGLTAACHRNGSVRMQLVQKGLHRLHSEVRED